MTPLSTTGLLFQAYVLFSCGKFVFYPRREEVGFCCPDCGAEVVRAKAFPEPIGRDGMIKIVRRDVGRIHLNKE